MFKKGYGVADLATMATITPSTNFNICSMTKQFTAYAVLQLQQPGKLSLDDRLSRFFPEFTPRIANSITVRHLLTHSSGLREHYDYVDRTKYQEFWDKDVLAALKDVDTLNFPPGSQLPVQQRGLLSPVADHREGLTVNPIRYTSVIMSWPRWA